MTAFTRLVKDQARQNLSVEGGEVHEFLPLAKELLEISSYWERGYGSGGTGRDREEERQRQWERVRESFLLKM